MSTTEGVIGAIDHIGSRWWFTDVVFLGVCATIVAIAAVLDPSAEAVSLFGLDVPVLCSWRQLTGLSCPGCGLTRSFTFMAHGRLVEAFQMNWIGPVLFAVVATQVPWRIVRLVRRRRTAAARPS